MLLVHGGCHGAWRWDPWLPWPARTGRSVIAIDRFAHGESRRLDLHEWAHPASLMFRPRLGWASTRPPALRYWWVTA